jgi:hypothetical protein
LTLTEGGGLKDFFQAEKLLLGEGFIAWCSAAFASIYHYGILGRNSISYSIINLPPPPIELDHGAIAERRRTLERQLNSSFNAACGGASLFVGILHIQALQGTLAQAMMRRRPQTNMMLDFRINREVVEPIIAMSHGLRTPILLAFNPTHENILCWSLPTSDRARGSGYIRDGAVVVSVSNEDAADAANACGFEFDPSTGTATRRTSGGVVERITFMHRRLNDNPSADISFIDGLNAE